MSEIKRISKTFIAYLKRPDLYPELGRKILKNTFNRNNALRGKEKTLDWASKKAVTQTEAIHQLFGICAEPLAQSFKSEIEEAKKTESECPIKMGGAGAMELIYYACEFTDAKSAVETGVAYGWSSLAALLSLKARNGVLYSSDMPYLSQNGDRYVGCVVPEDLHHYWKLFRHADRESLPKIFKDNPVFDVVHYDSDKSYNGRVWAYKELYKHLRTGGVFISDDIGDNSAYQDFCEQNQINTTIVEFEGKYIGVFIK